MNAARPNFDTAIDVPLTAVNATERLRRVDPDQVEGLKHAIELNGLSTPILVTPAGKGKYRLIAGAHRLEAIRQLGGDTIAARVVQGTDLQLQLLEIDENLIRHELRPWDRAVFLAKRKEIYDALHPEATRGAKGRQVIESPHTAKLAVWPKSFSEETAGRIGLGERSVDRALYLVKNIDPSLHSVIADLPLANNQSELEALAKVGKDVQGKVIELLTRDEDPAPRVRDAIAQLENRRVTPAAESDRKYQKLVDAWGRADKRAQRLFIQHLRETGQLPDN